MAELNTLEQFHPTERQLRMLRRITGKKNDAEAVSAAIDRLLKEDAEDRDLQQRLARKIREWDKQATPIDDWDAMMRDALRSAGRA